MLSILRFGVCRSSDSSIHVRRIFPRTNALLQPSLRTMTALPMTGFHRVQDLPCTENNTLELQLLSESCRALATSNVQTAILRWIPSVSGILTRFPCSANKNACPRGFRRLDGKSCLPRLLGSRICHKSHAIQFIICAPVLRTQKDPSCPAISQAKEVSYSLYIRFDCTQKLPFYLNRKGWLVARIVPIIYIFITIYHACVHFLSKIYIPILPQTRAIVKWYF